MTIMDAARAAAARPTYKELKAENERLRAMLVEARDFVSGRNVPGILPMLKKIDAALGNQQRTQETKP